MKHKDLTIIEEFPISRIKEEDKKKKKMDISDNKNEKIINAIIKSSINEEEKIKMNDIEEGKSQNQEKKEEKKFEEMEREIKQNEGQISKEEKIIEKGKDEEKEEEEEEEENDSILSNKPNIIPLRINRIININNIEQEKELLNFVDEIFNENNINFNLNKNINNKNAFEFENNSISKNHPIFNFNPVSNLKEKKS